MKSEYIELNTGLHPILVRTGKDAAENFELIGDSDPDDLWFHVVGKPSGHTVAAINEDMSKKELKLLITQCAVICKKHSNFASYSNLQIVYTRIKHVTKTTVMGTVLLSETKMIII